MKIKLRRVLELFVLHPALCVANIFPNHSQFNRLRGVIVAPFLKSCGRNFMIARGAILNRPDLLSVADDVYIAHDAWINATGGIFLESGVVISPKVVLASTQHIYRDGAVRLLESECAPITVGTGSWICSNSTITMGVTIGAGCIVAANSSVIRNLEAGWLYGGVPAQQVKDLRGQSQA